MGQVTVSINGRNYQIACDDGQENHLRRLAESVDKRVAELVAAVGQVGDTRLAVMTSVLLADEVSQSRNEIDRLNRSSETKNDKTAKARDDMAEKLDSLAERMENLAARLEQA